MNLKQYSIVRAKQLGIAPDKMRWANGLCFEVISLVGVASLVAD